MQVGLLYSPALTIQAEARPVGALPPSSPLPRCCRLVIDQLRLDPAPALSCMTSCFQPFHSRFASQARVREAILLQLSRAMDAEPPRSALPAVRREFILQFHQYHGRDLKFLCNNVSQICYEHSLFMPPRYTAIHSPMRPLGLHQHGPTVAIHIRGRTRLDVRKYEPDKSIKNEYSCGSQILDDNVPESCNNLADQLRSDLLSPNRCRQRLTKCLQCRRLSVSFLATRRGCDDATF